MKKYLIKMTFRARKVETTELEAESFKAAFHAGAVEADRISRNGRRVFCLSVSPLQ